MHMYVHTCVGLSLSPSPSPSFSYQYYTCTYLRCCLLCSVSMAELSTVPRSKWPHCQSINAECQRVSYPTSSLLHWTNIDYLGGSLHATSVTMTCVVNTNISCMCTHMYNLYSCYMTLIGVLEMQWSSAPQLMLCTRTCNWFVLSMTPHPLSSSGLP